MSGTFAFVSADLTPAGLADREALFGFKVPGFFVAFEFCDAFSAFSILLLHHANKLVECGFLSGDFARGVCFNGGHALGARGVFYVR